MSGIALLYRAGAALGALSLAVFAAGHLGLLNPAVLSVLAAIALAAFALSLKGLTLKHEPFSAIEKALLALSAVSVAAIIPLALMPPAVRDELIQHLAMPKLYLLKGGIYEMPHVGFSYLPQNIDLLYAIPLSLGCDVAPRLMHLLFAVLTAALVYLYLKPFAGRAYALLGFLLYMTTPLVFNLSRMAYIDNGVAFYSMLALMGLVKWHEEGEAKWLALSAGALGFALGAKYNAMIALLLFALFVFAGALRRGGLAAGVKASVLYAAVAVAVLSPWLMRNYAWTGSPFFPLFETAMQAVAEGEGVHLTGEMPPIAKRFAVYNEGALRVLLMPLRIFLIGADNSLQRFDGVLNPAYLLFLPLAFLGRAEGYRRALIVYALLFFGLAAFTVDIVTRYLMPVIPVVIIVLVMGIRRSLQPGRMRVFGAAALFGLLAFNFYYAEELYEKNRPFEAFSIGREAYLSRTLPDYAAVSYANRTIPAASKVMLFFTGDRGYYWERDYLYTDRMGRGLTAAVRSAKTPEDLKGYFTGLGVTHLLVNDSLFERFVNANLGPGEITLLTGFFREHAARLHKENGTSLYGIK